MMKPLLGDVLPNKALQRTRRCRLCRAQIPFAELESLGGSARMKLLLPILGQAGIGDLSALALLLILSIWPYHVANLFTTTPASYSLSKSVVQS